MSRTLRTRRSESRCDRWLWGGRPGTRHGGATASDTQPTRTQHHGQHRRGSARALGCTKPGRKSSRHLSGGARSRAQAKAGPDQRSCPSATTTVPSAHEGTRPQNRRCTPALGKGARSPLSVRAGPRALCWRHRERPDPIRGLPRSRACGDPANADTRRSHTTWCERPDAMWHPMGTCDLSAPSLFSSWAPPLT